MDHYYRLLELNPGAPDIEIKKAYRRLARKYHPDVSSEPNARERFIEITNAYEYLLERRYETPVQAAYTAPTPDRETLRRERARQYARMRHEQRLNEMKAFRSAWYYKHLRLLRLAVVYGLYTIAAGILISPIVAWYRMSDSTSMVRSVFLFIISVQVYALARSIYKRTKGYFDE